MAEIPVAPVSRQTISVEVIYIAIAGKVRADVQKLGAPIPVETLAELFPDMSSEQIIGYLGELVKAEKYKDIKVTTSPSGATYLYSDTVMTPEVASEKILAEETQVKIAGKVREETQTHASLTPVASFVDLTANLPYAKIEGYATAMAGNEKYQDIKSLVGPTGIAYLYSDTYMTDNYAALVARVEAKNPYATIAETVREESRIYPRPTKVEYFYAPVFQIESGQMEMIIEALLKKPEYADIKKIVASTGGIYLYSDQYMVQAAAERWVYKEEVERYTSP